MADSYLPAELPGVGLEISSSYDLNDFKTTCFLRCSTTPSNAPTGNYLNAWFIVIQSASGVVLQIVFGNPASDAPPASKKRVFVNNTWSEWKDL